MKYDFLIDAYETERLKVLGIWSEFDDADLPVRPLRGDPRGRSVHEQMVHQCVSEDAWFSTMLGIDVAAPPLPETDTRTGFMKRYAKNSGRRLTSGGHKSPLPGPAVRPVTERPDAPSAPGILIDAAIQRPTVTPPHHRRRRRVVSTQTGD